MKHEYYENDDVTLRGQWEIDGTAQTPDAGTAKIEVWKRGGHSTPAVIPSTTASISGTVVYHKITNLAIGAYSAFLTAKFSSGADERTGRIDFVVRKRSGN